jgi:hypothetical protein
MRRGLLLILLTAVGVQLSTAREPESRDLFWLLERRVRIQSPVLRPGWHEGLFNRQRREPPCSVVIIWKPRSSPRSSLQVERIIELRVVSELQAYSGSSAPVSTWAGRQLAELADDSLWRLIAPDVLNENKDCFVSSRSKCGSEPRS